MAQAERDDIRGDLRAAMLRPGGRTGATPPVRAGTSGGGDELPRGERDPQRPVYLHIGTPAAGGDAARVYELEHEASQPLMPPKDRGGEDLAQRLRGDEPKLLVQGDHAGGDEGAPLLRNMQVVGEWHGPTETRTQTAERLRAIADRFETQQRIDPQSLGALREAADNLDPPRRTVPLAAGPSASRGGVRSED